MFDFTFNVDVFKLLSILISPEEKRTDRLNCLSSFTNLFGVCGKYETQIICIFQ